MPTMKEHWRIKILDFGTGACRWCSDRGRVAEFQSEAAAIEKLGVVEAFRLGPRGMAEVVKIPSGATEPDKFLGNVKD